MIWNKAISVLIVPLILVFFLISCDNHKQEEPWSFEQISAFGNTPVFSPDGDKIAFGGEDSLGLWIYDLGSGLTDKIFSGAVNYDHAWSPASDALVFSTPGGAERELWIVDLAENLSPLVSPGINPSWSPDGTEIVYQDASYGGIYRIPTTGGTVQMISLFGEYPKWSPDGSMVAFRSGMSPSFYLYVWNKSIGITSMLVSCGSNYDWSPDASAIVYEIYEIVGGSGYYWNIRKTNILNPVGVLLWQGGKEPKWSPDGAYILIRGLSGFSGTGLLLFPASGGSAEQITSDGYQPSFDNTGNIIAYSLSNNGVWIAIKNQ
jgi:Tol biopolymer transport system component